MNTHIIIIRNWDFPYAAGFAGGGDAPCACDPGGFRYV